VGGPADEVVAGGGTRIYLAGDRLPKCDNAAPVLSSIGDTPGVKKWPAGRLESFIMPGKVINRFDLY
jgi:hypothetical protein